MAGALRKTMVYLGLAEDEQYDAEYVDDGYDEAYEQEGSGYSSPEPRAQVTPLRSVTPLHDAEVAPLNRITTIHPRTYNDARAIGESFRANTPVIMNLTDMDDADAKRLVDFAAGLVFGLHGSIERVTNKVFLLSPEHIEVDAEGSAAEPGPARGLFNQS